MGEADRMIDLGFEEPVNKILDALPASTSGSSESATSAAEAYVIGSHQSGVWIKQVFLFDEWKPVY